MVGFDKRQREKMEELIDDEATLMKCDLSRNDRTREMEIIITNRTEVFRSPTKLPVAEMPTGSGSNIKQIMLESVNFLDAYSMVNVKGTVRKIDECLTVGVNQINRHKVSIADSGGKVHIILWAEKVGTLKKGRSYFFYGMTISAYKGKRYLSLTKGGSICEIEDIGEVVRQSSSDDSDDRTMKNALGAAVCSINDYRSCFICNSRVFSTSTNLGQCTKCNVMQRPQCCNSGVTAVLVKHEYLPCMFPCVLCTSWY